MELIYFGLQQDAYALLYNPHGSDGTASYLLDALNSVELYNPHGSDGTMFFKFLWFLWLWLYNPHGSDGTLWFQIKKFYILHFITHTVQMEQFLAAESKRHWLTL